jgi:competence protein ComEA
MGWKDYFYFTKTERNGIVVMSLLIISILLYPLIHNSLISSSTYDYSGFRQKVEQYEMMLAEYREARLELEKMKQSSFTENLKSPLILQPFRFNPNNIGSEDFIEMGIPERVANNIIRYREAGGNFRYREDLKRIYSLHENLYVQLENYIDLPAKPVRKDTAEGNDEKIKTEPQKNQERFTRYAEVLIHINEADTTQWQQIRGIGPVFSKRITAYRELLGGFYSTEQLREVFGIDSLKFEQISEHIFIDSIKLRKININSADFATLIKHPYLNRNQVNSILRIRERHGKYNSIADIKKSDLITEKDFSKIAPYLSIADDKSD